MLLMILTFALSPQAALAKINYADVRTGVAHAFEERAHEVAATLQVLLESSKATVAMMDNIEARCR